MSISQLINVFLFFSIFLYTSCESAKNAEDYSDEIRTHREEVESFLATSDASPFKGINKQPLQFFPPDLAYKVQATITKNEALEYLNVPKSDGKSDRYLKYGYASFKLDGQQLKLLLLKPTGIKGRTDEIFLAFSDLTSGESTYGGGRYLDLQHKGSNQIIIDFNKAYNPYCAYNESFSCPLPPVENKLSVAVLAGEKSYVE